MMAVEQVLDRQFVGITNDALDNLRQRIGVEIRDTIEPWCHEATRDNIRHYAHGIGDDNPLWCDPQYAAGGPFGELVAPPSFLMACNRIISGYVGGLPGVHAMWAGCDFQWFAPIRRNREIRTKAWLKDLIEHETRFAGRSIQQIYHVDFSDDQGTALAAADSWCFRTDRDIARERGSKYDTVKQKPPKVYTDAEIGKVNDLYANEEVRGGTSRYWEDVAEDGAMPVVVKGPMTVTGFIAYAQGWGGLYIRAHKLAWKLFDEHPGAAIRNAQGIPDCPERVHWETEMARRVGVPEAYDYGPERFSWLTHYMTNWIGDAGFLKRLSCQIRRHNPVGDTLYITGEITRKYIADGENLVDVALSAVNQDGERSAIGHAVASLPSRG